MTIFVSEFCEVSYVPTHMVEVDTLIGSDW